MLKLVEKGITREVAYKVVQDNAMKSWNTGQEFKDLLIKDNRITGKISGKEIESMFDPVKVLKNVDYIFKNVGLK